MRGVRTTMTHDENPYKVFHSPHVDNKKKIHLVLVRPEEPGNVGSIARVMANMGIDSPLRIVGGPEIMSDQAFRLAKHAGDVLKRAQYFKDLPSAMSEGLGENPLRIATTAEVGSPDRPHPLWAREAVSRSLDRLRNHTHTNVVWVFGPEGDGLTNEEVALCDWIATIPSTSEYRSLNLAQATLVFCYEIQMALVTAPPERDGAKPSQKQRLVTHMLQVAQDVGFILPGDPYKMLPKLENLFAGIPNHVKEAQTLHGLLDQISRSVKKGMPDFKGRFGQRMKEENDGRIG